ncbi:RNA-binding protein [Tissierella sp. MSJ-40]|uniref:RNA-binding protein n=1 Tax=Tissierella simiarum TaxID=2841534 RepID=A0ABS6EBX3_9FIRM|nr:YlmH/Sll1252 family protein [Tissierella simiarum]MBU5440366.1 RNA-binding protein [Tissierella simiarum]
MRLDRDKYISHIQDRDKIMEMRKVIDKVEIVCNNYSIETTDFLDPYERKLAKSILNSFDEISYYETGGLKEGERQVIVIYPYYYDKENIDDYIVGLKIEGNLERLSHKDFLGAILHLGIKRSKIGDILIHGNYVEVIVKKEISDFLLLNLDRVSNEKVKICIVSLDQISPSKIDYKEIKLTLSSFRLDVLISSTYNLSRQESQNIIKSGKVKVNWEPIDKSSKDLEEGDIVSVKGYGRCILYSIEGFSKKGRIKSTVRILI